MCRQFGCPVLRKLRDSIFKQDRLDLIAFVCNQSRRKTKNLNQSVESLASSDCLAPDTPLLLQVQYMWCPYNLNRYSGSVILSSFELIGEKCKKVIGTLLSTRYHNANLNFSAPPSYKFDCQNTLIIQYFFFSYKEYIVIAYPDLIGKSHMLIINAE